jgi:hypothetical protein
MRKRFVAAPEDQPGAVAADPTSAAPSYGSRSEKLDLDQIMSFRYHIGLHVASGAVLQFGFAQ